MKNPLKTIRIAFAFTMLIAFQQLASAQTLPVGAVGLEDYYRRAQLLGDADSSVSFTIRPVYPKLSFKAKDVFYPDSVENRGNFTKTSSTIYRSKNGMLDISLLPFSILTENNSTHPYGWNDGSMIPAKGFQTLISGGFYMKYGILSIQFRPEFDYAVNSAFSTWNSATYGITSSKYYDIYNNIDLPARFGTSQYSQAFLGQSSILLNYKGASFGLSTENLWWGPGIQNSLLMSNTAPCFKHLTLNTSKPIKTAIGSFEGQLIAGRLENSNYGVLTPEIDYFSSPLYVPKLNDPRYISGIVATWQPKWIPGLFLGLTRSSQMYVKDQSKIGDYFPFFSSTSKVTADQALNKSDNRSSLFMRWLWPEEHAEVYFEYGKDNSSSDLRNQALEASRNRAYTFGLRKIVPFNKGRNESILISIEATQLQETNTADIANGDSWYVNKYVRQGYTNSGQEIGAGIGPGGNLQTLDVSWVKGLKKLGIQFQRYIHNNDLYYYTYTDDLDARRHWTDISIALTGEWNYKNFIFNAKLMEIKSLNYQWYLYESPTDIVWVNGANAFNTQLQAGITYRF